MTQVFIIINSEIAQLCYFSNSVIDKVIETFATNVYDNVEEKRYISSTQIEELEKVFDTLGITWIISENVGNPSIPGITKYLVDNLEKSKTISNPHFFHRNRMQEIHKLRKNSIRISRQLDMIRVELPMSLYSFNILNKLRKSYSMDCYGWNFIGDQNIANLFETCAEHEISIIQEINNRDVRLSSGSYPLV